MNNETRHFMESKRVEELEEMIEYANELLKINQANIAASIALDALVDAQAEAAVANCSLYICCRGNTLKITDYEKIGITVVDNETGEIRGIYNN